ncbi:MAG: YdeI/OmpD-associated family protein [Saonia sp.]
MTIKYFTHREDWRHWLKENFDTTDEIWLEYPKKTSGKPRIEYNNAVEEALCFGWIDSTVKSLNKNTTIQRFTKRRKNSTFSQANKERLKWLFENDMLHHSIKAQVHGIINEEFIFPEDIIATLKEDNKVWDNYQKLSDSYKRIRVAYIESARKRPDEFNKRLNNFRAKTRDKKLIKGFGGINKYY